MSNSFNEIEQKLLTWFLAQYENLTLEIIEMNYFSYEGLLKINIYDICGNCLCSCISIKDYIAIKDAINASIKIAGFDKRLLKSFPQNSIEVVAGNMNFQIFRNNSGKIVLMTMDGLLSGPFPEGEIRDDLMEIIKRLGFKSSKIPEKVRG